MFRKIHSNRDPRDTIISELKKEFRPYVEKTGNGLKGMAERYPKFLFWAMVVNITLSIILVSTVFRHKNALPKKQPVTVVAPSNAGFDQIMQIGNTLRKTIHLKSLIDSLSAKKNLSVQDSVMLDSALDKLQSLNKNVNPKLKP